MQMTQQFFIIPNNCEWLYSQRLYQQSQAQLKEQFALFAEQAGLESRDASIRLWDLGILLTPNDRKKFGACLMGPVSTWLPYTYIHKDSTLYHEWCSFLEQAGISPIPETGFRHLCSYKGRDAYFQMFSLHEFTYGTILAPKKFKLDDQLLVINPLIYYSELSKYMVGRLTAPPFKS